MKEEKERDSTSRPDLMQWAIFNAGVQGLPIPELGKTGGGRGLGRKIESSFEHTELEGDFQ